MAIILDEDNKVVTVENQPDAPRAMFKNLPEAGVGDVLINGASIVDANGDADIPIGKGMLGSVMVAANGSGGLQIINETGELKTVGASEGDLKTGASVYTIIRPGIQHTSTFYGLAKAAGDTTQALSANAVGNYTDEAKIAIQKMLGISEKLELLQTITTTEDLEEIDIDISTTPCNRLYVNIETPPNGQTGQIIRASMRKIDNTQLTLMYLYQLDRSTQKTYAAFLADSRSGRHFADQRTGNYALTNGTNVFGRPDMFGFLENSVYDTTIKIYGSIYPTGTIINVYGTRI